jgi:putative transcriptional regulator
MRVRRMMAALAQALALPLMLLAAIPGGSPGRAPHAVNVEPPSDAEKSSFLIARRGLEDPLFAKSVVLMLPVVDKDVVVGLIVNKATHVALHEIFPKDSALKDRRDVLYFGGPVDVKTLGALFRAPKASKNAFHLTGDLYVSFNADLIEGILKKPKQVTDARLFLGRSQWGPEQLRGEMERGSWYGEQEENSLIFSADPDSVWPVLIEQLEPGDMAEMLGCDGAGGRKKAREFPRFAEDDELFETHVR